MSPGRTVQPSFSTDKAPQPVTPTGSDADLIEYGADGADDAVMGCWVDWTEWRQFFRGMGQYPLLEHILLSRLRVRRHAVQTTAELRLKMELGGPTGRTGGIIGRAITTRP